MARGQSAEASKRKIPRKSHERNEPRTQGHSKTQARVKAKVFSMFRTVGGGRWGEGGIEILTSNLQEGF